MAIARPAWPRVVIQSVPKSGTDGGALIVGNSQISCTVVGGTSLTNTRLCCLPVPTQPAASWWSNSPEGEPGQDTIAVVVRVSPTQGTSGVYLQVATSPEAIDPTDGADLFNQWNGTDGYSARVNFGTTFLSSGINYLVLEASTAHLAYIRENGLMFGFDESNYPDESVSIDITLYPVLYDHYQFPVVSALLADPTGDNSLARPVDDPAFTALMEDPLNAGILTTTGGSFFETSANLNLTGSDILSAGFSQSEIKPLELASIPSNTITSELAAPDGTSWKDHVGLSLAIWRTVKNKLGRFRVMGTGGKVKSAVQSRHKETLVLEPAGATLPLNEFWTPTGGSVGGERMFNGSIQTYNPGWAANTPLIDILWDCVMNSRHDAKYRDIYPDDWYWLRMRLDCIYADITAAEMIETAWAGSTYADLATWCMTMLGLYCGLSRNGNLLVWHPAVYRPSRRSYTLNLDTDTDDGGTLQTLPDWLSTVRLTGTDARTPAPDPYEHDDMMSIDTDPADLDQDAGGATLDIEPVNNDGICPVTIFDSDVCRNALLRQYLQRGGKCILVTGTVGKRGMLWDLGDLLTISTARASTHTYMITSLKPSDDGASTYFEAVYFPNWPAAASGFSQDDAPWGLYRGAYAPLNASTNTITNRTWRTDALKLADLGLSAPGGAFVFDERLGSREGTGWSEATDYTTYWMEVACDRDQATTTYIDLEFSFNYNATWGAATQMVIWEWANSTHEGLILIATKGTDDVYLTLAYTSDVTDPFNGALYTDSAGPFLVEPPSVDDYGERMVRVTIAVGETGASLNASGLADSIAIDAASGTGWTIRWRGRYDGTYACVAHSYMSIGPSTWWDNVTSLIPMNGEDIVY